MKKNEEQMTFEQALTRVEEITARLSSPSTAVDESIALYKEASVLLAVCGEKLATAKLEIEHIEVKTLPGV
jgi:exodeoxyribonuclease VII small subunit